MPNSRLDTFTPPRDRGARDLRQMFNAGIDEHAIHVALVGHLRHRACDRVWWTHIPSGERRPPGVGGKLKGMGLKEGIPDFALVIAGRAHHLELKKIGGKVSSAQKATLAELAAAGAVTAIAFGLDEALSVLVEWGAIR